MATTSTKMLYLAFRREIQFIQQHFGRMKKIIFSSIITFIFFCLVSVSETDAQTAAQKKWIQDRTAVTTLRNLADSLDKSYQKNYEEALNLAKIRGWSLRQVLPDNRLAVLVGIDESKQPIYHVTENAGAAISIGTNLVHPVSNLGFNLSGAKEIAGVWEAGGAVLLSHREFEGRVQQIDNPGTTTEHATHVTGTINAAGFNTSAKGMAYESFVRAFDSSNDLSEVATEASNGLLISNHSYGIPAGWRFLEGSWQWAGNTNISSNEDHTFGFYSSTSQAWDNLARNAPYLLSVKSAGNQRNEGPSGNPTPPRNGPYDCMTHMSLAKNIMTVAAVNPVSNGYNGPNSVTMSSFSSWGPTDDGRIKPDISANGVNLTSTSNSSNNAYNTISGTSMAAPSVAGSLLLLQEHYSNTHNKQYMKSATLKGLVIHTADEAGPAAGPDYMFGWGLMNTHKAAQVISNDSVRSVIEERSLSNNQTFTKTVYATGTQPLVATICWTDLPGTPVSPASLNPPNKMLVNDLDLRITAPDNTIHLPWVLGGRANPTAVATRNDNNTDNVEKIEINAPTAGFYTITVTHKGTITGNTQDFSLIVTGIANADTAITCKGTKYFQAREGSFDDGSGNKDYANNSDCIWVVENNDSTSVFTINFTQMNIAAGDTVYIFSGKDLNAPLAAKYSGNTLPNTLFINQAAFTVNFKTDVNNNAAGWQLKYQSFQKPRIAVSGTNAACKEVGQTYSVESLLSNNADLTFSFNIPNATIQPINTNNVVASFNAAGTQKVYAIAQNPAGTTIDSLSVKVSEVRNAPKIFDFEDALFPQTSVPSWDWEIETENNIQAFLLTNAAAAEGQYSVRIRNQGSGVSTGRTRSLITPPLRLQGVVTAPVNLTFKYAYAKRVASNSCTLTYFISQNCGASWQKIQDIISNGNNTVSNPNLVLETNCTTPPCPPVNTDFVPNSTQWRTVTRNLIPYINSQAFRVKFQVFNATGGNLLYLDDIRINGVPIVSLEEQVETQSLQLDIFPIPTNSTTEIWYEIPENSTVTWKLSDALGRLITTQQQNVIAGKHQKNLQSLTNKPLNNGIYFLEMSNGKQSITKKFVVAE